MKRGAPAGAPLLHSAFRFRPRLAAAAAAVAVALDRAAGKRAGDGADDRTGRVVAAAVDRAAGKRTGGAADDQPGGAVGPAAIIAAVATAPGRPDIIAVAVVIAAVALGLGAVDRHGERGRNGHGRRRDGEDQFTHLYSPFERNTRLDNAPATRTVSLT